MAEAPDTMAELAESLSRIARETGIPEPLLAASLASRLPVRGRSQRRRLFLLTIRFLDCSTEQRSQAGYDLRGHQEPLEINPGWFRMIDKAVEQAHAWHSLGIQVLTTFPHGALRTGHPEQAGILFAFGPLPSLPTRKIALLHSRKPRRVTPETSWPADTRKALREAGAAPFQLVTSYGTPGYDLSSFAASNQAEHFWTICPDDSPFRLASAEEPAPLLRPRLDLFDPDKTTWLCSFPPGCGSTKDREIRDWTVAAVADELWAVDVRARGIMAAVLAHAQTRGKPVRRVSSSSPASGSPKPSGTRPDPGPLPRTHRAFHPCRRSRTEPMLFHYTRANPGPWPGQTIKERLGEILSARPEMEHTAFHALKRILAEGRIRASSKLTRGRQAVVCFSECPPTELAFPASWNRALIRWNFEPYGLAFPMDALRRLGVMPVIYAGEEAYGPLGEADGYRFQLHNPPKTDWSREKEWRLPGDLLLDRVSREHLRVLVTTRREAEEVLEVFGIRVWEGFEPG